MRSVKKALKALDKPDPSQSQSEQVQRIFVCTLSSPIFGHTVRSGQISLLSANKRTLDNKKTRPFFLFALRNNKGQSNCSGFLKVTVCILFRPSF
jgi:hypothetical protein